MKKSLLVAIIIVLVLAVAVTIFFVLKSSYNVRLDTDGGVANVSTFKCKVGEQYRIPVATKEGYDFDGWFDNPDCTGEVISNFGINNIFQSKNLTFYAKFVKRCQINYVLPGFYTDNPITVRADETVELKDPEVTGVIFDGWYLDEHFLQPIQTIKNPKDDMTIYARLLQPYGINYILNGGQNNPDNPLQYASEIGAELFAPTKEGYEFDGWIKDDGKPISNITMGTTGLVNVTATWKPKTYTITWKLDGGKMPEDFDIVSYVVGEGVSADKMMFPKSDDRIFLHWYRLEGDEEIIVTSIDSDMIGDIVLYAKWYDNTPIKYPEGSKNLWYVSYEDTQEYKHFNEDNIYIKVPTELKGYAADGRLGVSIYVKFEAAARTQGNATTKSSVFFRINGEAHKVCSVSATGAGYFVGISAQTGPLETVINDKTFDVMFDGNDEIVLGYDYYLESNSVNFTIHNCAGFVCHELSYSYFVIDEPEFEEPGDEEPGEENPGEENLTENPAE